ELHVARERRSLQIAHQFEPARDAAAALAGAGPPAAARRHDDERRKRTIHAGDRRRDVQGLGVRPRTVRDDLHFATGADEAIETRTLAAPVNASSNNGTPAMIRMAPIASAAETMSTRESVNGSSDGVRPAVRT